MKLSLHAGNSPEKRIRAVVCLVAVLLLWSPAWAAVLQANGIGCCDGAMCPVHGNASMHHEKGAAASDKSAQPMQCAHSGGGSMMDCGMSCCDEQSQSFVASIQFVLPPAAVVTPSADSVSAACVLELNQVLQPFDPIAPPPRNFLLSL